MYSRFTPCKSVQITHCLALRNYSWTTPFSLCVSMKEELETGINLTAKWKQCSQGSGVGEWDMCWSSHASGCSAQANVDTFTTPTGKLLHPFQHTWVGKWLPVLLYERRLMLDIAQLPFLPCFFLGVLCLCQGCISPFGSLDLLSPSLILHII